MTEKDILQRLTINGEMPTLNEYIKAERGNRYAGAKLKKEATDLVAYQTIGTPQIMQKVDVLFEWHTTRRADPDNIAFMKKFVLDGLVRSGVLKDDSQKHVGEFSDKIIKDKEDFVIITLAKSK